MCLRRIRLIYVCLCIISYTSYAFRNIYLLFYANNSILLNISSYITDCVYIFTCI